MSHHYLLFDDVHYRYPNGYEALRGVSFRITHGEKVALVGANGAGKSTLLLHTDGLLMPSQGEVVMGGITLTRRTLPLVRAVGGGWFSGLRQPAFHAHCRGGRGLRSVEHAPRTA